MKCGPFTIVTLMLTGLVDGENAKIQYRFPIYDEFVASFAFSWTPFIEIKVGRNPSGVIRIGFPE